MHIGLVGLGKMGGNMRTRMRNGGVTVVGYDRNPDVTDVASLAELVAELPSPKVVWVMVPAGDITRSTVEELIDLLDEGDVIVDGGNSRWTDDEKHAALAAEKKIGYIDCGVSGGATSGGTGSSYPSTGGVAVDPAAAQAYARSALGSYGWGSDQFSCLVSLWTQESGWRANALNVSSGAYGIPQSLPANKMGVAGADWRTNAATQINWGLAYIHDAYGSPCAAWNHEMSENPHWY